MLNRIRNLIGNKNTSVAAAPNKQAVIDTLEDRRMMAVSGGAIGINVNDASTAFMNKAVPVMKNLGVTSVRLWLTVDFNSRTKSGTLDRAKDYAAKGFDVMLIIQPKDGKVYPAATVKSWFSWAASDTALKNAVDRWEIGNEPDHKVYWKGSFSSYVTDLLKPASEALHAAGEKVVSAGPSWNSQDVQKMIDAGLLKYADFIGYHPYAKGVSLVKQRISEINKVVAGRKPIIASEWNVRGFEGGNKTAWAQAVKDVYGSIKGGFAYNYYFALKVQNSMAGPAGILTSSGSPNGPFYNAFASFSGQAGVSVGSGNTASSTPSPASPAPSTSGGGSIAGQLWNDTDGDGKWDSNETVTGSGRRVFIDADGDGKFDAGEKYAVTDSKGSYKFTGLAAGTYKVSREFPSGYKLSNGTKFLTVSLSANQAKTGINLGSERA